MKSLLTGLIVLISVAAFSQHMTWEQWEEASATHINLRPKYGYAELTRKQKKADRKFIELVIQLDTTLRKGSKRFMRLGFSFLNQNDLKTAMRRFNQAYLLDSTNSDIYWGYGAVYWALGNYDKAKEQFDEGLEVDPENSHLLRCSGIYFKERYHTLKEADQESAMLSLDVALQQMNKSYDLDSTNANTAFELSILYLLKGDCDKAWNYYNECNVLGGELMITEEYTRALEQRCGSPKD